MPIDKAELISVGRVMEIINPPKNAARMFTNKTAKGKKNTDGRAKIKITAPRTTAPIPPKVKTVTRTSQDIKSNLRL